MENGVNMQLHNYKDFDSFLARYRMVHDRHDGSDMGFRVNRLYGLDSLIKENLGSTTIMCELGSYAGVSSSLFAYYCKHIYCVDSWLHSYDGHDDIEKIFDETMSGFFNVTKVKGFSNLVVNGFENNFFDFVYVDADHSYESAKEDILLWLPKIKSGGAIGGHDYNGVGVRTAVDELFGKKIKVYEDSSWYIKL